MKMEDLSVRRKVERLRMLTYKAIGVARDRPQHQALRSAVSQGGTMHET